MKTFGSRLLLVVVAGLPAWSWAATLEGSNPLKGHWDSVFLITLGGLIVWREVRFAKRGLTRRGNSWQALNTWRKPVSQSAVLMPVLAKLAFRR